MKKMVKFFKNFFPSKKGGFEPVVSERQIVESNNILWAIAIGILFIIIELGAILVFDLSLTNASFLGVGLIVLYSIILFFLIEPTLLREIKHFDVRTIEKPVIKEVEKPVVKEIEKFVDRPVPVYIERKRQKLVIPKYNFVGSTETKTYHTRNCRFGKLIKKKYKVQNNSESYFKKRKFRGCKVCIKKKVKK